MYESYRVPKELLMKPIIKSIPIMKTNWNIPDIDIKSISELNFDGYVRDYFDGYVRDYGQKIEEYLINLFKQFGVKKEDILSRVTARRNGDRFEKDIYIDGWYAFTLKSTTEFDFSSEMKANISIIPYRRNI